MFQNIGKKLCGLAKFLAVFGVLAVIAGIGCVVWGILGRNAMAFIGIGCIVGGIVEIIFPWPLYAFGQLTEDVHALRVIACDQPAPNYSLDLD